MGFVAAREVSALILVVLSCCEDYLPNARKGAPGASARADLGADPVALASPPSAAVAALSGVSVASASNAPSATPPTATEPARPAPRANVEQDFPLYGLAVYMQAQVFTEPNAKAAVLGYMRRGARFRAKPGVSGPGCDSRWHALHTGGFVCADRSVLVGTSPPEFAVLPAPPTLTAALPYDYQKNLQRDTPLYAHRPTPDEVRELADWIAHTPNAAERLAHAAAPPPPVPVKKVPGKKQPPPPPPPPVLKAPESLRLLLQPGYYVSIDGPEADPDGRALLRTVRGDVLVAHPDTAVHASVLHGFALGSTPLANLALVQRGGAKSYTRDPISGRLQPSAALQMMEPISLTDERVRDAHGELAVTQDGLLVPVDALRMIPHTPRPAFVPSGARYIAVQLSSQTLVAYEGERAVYATLVATGKTGFETPTGIYRIQHKHVSATMDGEVGTDEDYRIEDVPWTMYFSGSLALHAAFWHERFGHPRSHGCVNLAPLDARWLFDWATPTLPPGFHGVNSSRENPGTFVVITQ